MSQWSQPMVMVQRRRPGELNRGGVEAHDERLSRARWNILVKWNIIIVMSLLTLIWLFMMKQWHWRLINSRWWRLPGWQPVRQASIPSSAPLRRWQGKSKPQSRRNASEQCWGWNPPRLAQSRTCNWQLNNWEPGQVSLSTCLGRWAERANGTRVA